MHYLILMVTNIPLQNNCVIETPCLRKHEYESRQCQKVIENAGIFENGFFCCYSKNTS